MTPIPNAPTVNARSGQFDFVPLILFLDLPPTGLTNRWRNHFKNRYSWPAAGFSDTEDRRRESVEHPFGTIKQWMYQGAFLMRRLENVRGEFSLTALAYNIKRAITLVGVAGLITAVRA